MLVIVAKDKKTLEIKKIVNLKLVTQKEFIDLRNNYICYGKTLRI